MIVDAHTHSWPSRGCYQDLLVQMDTVGVDAAVVVSACVADDLDNNEYVAGAVAFRSGRLYQLVDVDSRWSPLYHQAGAADRLALLCERLTPAGVSHYLATANDGWLLSAEGRAFFGVASRRGLIVSLAATPSWHADIGKVAALFPATPVLLNHLALVMLHPSGVAGALDMVRQGAGPGHDNLIVKVSGYYYGPRPGPGPGSGSGPGPGPGPPSGYPFADRLEIVRAFYETWGPHRMVWASDYPASAPHITYRQSLEVIREHATFIAPPDLALILGGTMQSLLKIQNLFLS